MGAFTSREDKIMVNIEDIGCVRNNEILMLLAILVIIKIVEIIFMVYRKYKMYKLRNAHATAYGGFRRDIHQRRR